MSKQSVTRWIPYLTLRNKIIIGFAMLLFLIASDMEMMLWQGAQLSEVGVDVIELRQPAMRLALQLSQKIDLAMAEHNGYLLTGYEDHKKRFQQLENASIKNLFELNRILSNLSDKNQIRRLVKAERVFTEFRGYAKQAIYLHDHPAANYPGMALASETLNPLNLECIGIINTLDYDWSLNELRLL